MLKQRAIELFGHGYVTRTEPFNSKNIPETHPLSPDIRRFEQENQYDTLASRISALHIEWPVAIAVLQSPSKNNLVHSTPQAALNAELTPRGIDKESFIFSRLGHAKWEAD